MSPILFLYIFEIMQSINLILLIKIKVPTVQDNFLYQLI